MVGLERILGIGRGQRSMEARRDHVGTAIVPSRLLKRQSRKLEPCSTGDHHESTYPHSRHRNHRGRSRRRRCIKHLPFRPTTKPARRCMSFQARSPEPSAKRSIARAECGLQLGVPRRRRSRASPGVTKMVIAPEIPPTSSQYGLGARDTLVEAGYRAARASLPRIRRAITEK